MVTFLLVPGAGGDASYWSELVPLLERDGHEAIAVDIREDDPALGLPEYARIVEQAAGDRTGVIMVAQSLGGFTAPMADVDLRALVFVNAMIPVPGETPGAWFAATGASDARRAGEEAAGRGADFDVEWHFLHDVPADVRARLDTLPPPRDPADTPFGQPCTFQAWPDVPLHVVTGCDDRFFPASFQVRVARERLGIEARVVPGGHLLALADAGGLAAALSDVVLRQGAAMRTFAASLVRRCRAAVCCVPEVAGGPEFVGLQGGGRVDSAGPSVGPVMSQDIGDSSASGHR